MLAVSRRASVALPERRSSRPTFLSPPDQTCRLSVSAEGRPVSKEEALGLEAAVAMQFLDRQPGEWYCTDCWAEAVDAVDIDARTVYRLAVLMATEEAVAAGYQA